MILGEKDYRIEEDGIWISKKALEEAITAKSAKDMRSLKCLIGLLELILESVTYSTTY